MKYEQLKEIWGNLTNEQKENVVGVIRDEITVGEDATNKCIPRIKTDNIGMPITVPGEVIETFDSTDICSIYCERCADWFDSHEFDTKINEFIVLEHVLTHHID